MPKDIDTHTYVTIRIYLYTYLLVYVYVYLQAGMGADDYECYRSDHETWVHISSWSISRGGN